MFLTQTILPCIGHTFKGLRAWNFCCIIFSYNYISMMDNTVLFTSNKVPILYYTTVIAIQYNANTNTIWDDWYCNTTQWLNTMLGTVIWLYRCQMYYTPVSVHLYNESWGQHGLSRGLESKLPVGHKFIGGNRQTDRVKYGGSTLFKNNKPHQQCCHLYSSRTLPI